MGERDELITVLQREMPWYISAAMRHQIAIANQLRLPVAELHAIGTLLEFGAIGVRGLAELMGMTTGATTRLVDRLETAGFVTRERSDQDRRQVVLHVRHENVAEIARYFHPIGERWQAQLSGYSDEQLSFLIEFLRRGRESAQLETEALRDGGRAHGSRRPQGQPGKNPDYFHEQ